MVGGANNIEKQQSVSTKTTFLVGKIKIISQRIKLLDLIRLSYSSFDQSYEKKEPIILGIINPCPNWMIIANYIANPNVD